MLYLDTSILVTVFTPEPETPKVQNWLEARMAEHLVISDWVITEFSAALSLKLRTGQVSGDQRARALNLFNRAVADNMSIAPVVQRHFTLATRFANQASSGLRAGDALHLAIAADIGAVLCTRDRRLLEAAIAQAVPALAP